jgi:hypothetical protein
MLIIDISLFGAQTRFKATMNQPLSVRMYVCVMSARLEWGT